MKFQLSKNQIFLILKITFSICCIYYVYSSLEKSQVGLIDFIQIILNDFEIKKCLLLIICIALLFVNWGFEALKTYFLSKNITQISFVNVYKSVFAAVSIGLITPQIVGDYVSRNLYLSSKFKEQTLAIIFICRTAQLVITIFYGIIAIICLYFLQPIDIQLFNKYYLIIILVVFTGIFLIFFIKIPELKIFTFIEKHININKIILYFNQVTFAKHLLVIGLSLCRFMVFTVQYMILLHIFGIEIKQVVIILNIWMTFFVKSLLPTINFLNELGVREATAIFFFGKSGIATQPVLIASFILWVINIVIPSLIGLIVLNFSKTKE